MSTIVFTLLVFILTLGAVWFLFRPAWMGLEGKTAWDWFTLFTVPTVVGLATAVFNHSRELILRDTVQEEAVQTFIQRISDLALDARAAGSPDIQQAVGRAQTAALLQTIDGARAGRVLLFLDEIGFLATFDVPLIGQDLANAELEGVTLDNLDLEDADLRGADLEGASLRGANLEGADLRDADLEMADAREADFTEVNLGDTDMGGADLRGAILTGARGLDSGELSRACLEETTRLPPGFETPSGRTRACDAPPPDDD